MLQWLFNLISALLAGGGSTVCAVRERGVGSKQEVARRNGGGVNAEVSRWRTTLSWSCFQTGRAVVCVLGRRGHCRSSIIWTSLSLRCAFCQMDHHFTPDLFRVEKIQRGNVCPEIHMLGSRPRDSVQKWQFLLKSNIFLEIALKQCRIRCLRLGSIFPFGVPFSNCIRSMKYLALDLPLKTVRPRPRILIPSQPGSSLVDQLRPEITTHGEFGLKWQVVGCVTLFRNGNLC